VSDISPSCLDLDESIIVPSKEVDHEPFNDHSFQVSSLSGKGAASSMFWDKFSQEVDNKKGCSDDDDDDDSEEDMSESQEKENHKDNSFLASASIKRKVIYTRIAKSSFQGGKKKTKPFVDNVSEDGAGEPLSSNGSVPIEFPTFPVL
jgi:hypothetical protein